MWGRVAGCCLLSLLFARRPVASVHRLHQRKWTGPPRDYCKPQPGRQIYFCRRKMHKMHVCGGRLSIMKQPSALQVTPGNWFPFLSYSFFPYLSWMYRSAIWTSWAAVPRCRGKAKRVWNNLSGGIKKKKKGEGVKIISFCLGVLKSCLHGCAVCLCAAASHGRRGDACAGCRRNQNNRAGTFDWGWIETFHVLDFSTQTWHVPVFWMVHTKDTLVYNSMTFGGKKNGGENAAGSKMEKKKKSHSHVYGSSTCRALPARSGSSAEPNRTLWTPALLRQPPLSQSRGCCGHKVIFYNRNDQSKLIQYVRLVLKSCTAWTPSTHIHFRTRQEVKVLHAKHTLSVMMVSVLIFPHRWHFSKWGSGL